MNSNSASASPLLFQVLERLLSAGALVAARNFAGETALMRAADAGHRDAVLALMAAGADPATDEWFSGNQPLPSLSNTRGTVQLPLETPDALSVDCIYFPPFFSTCDGSRSDSRDDRKPDPTGPVHEQPAFGGATQNLRINGAPLVSTAFKWTPAELVRRASAAGRARPGST